MFGSPAGSGGVVATPLPPERDMAHEVAPEAEYNFCAARDEIKAFVDEVKLLVPELGVFASHGTWSKYVLLQTERIEKLLELKSRNTPDCKRVVSAAHDSVLELTRLVEQAYINMMRYEAQNTINSFKNHGEYAAFMLSLALPSLPKTVEEAQRLSKLQVH